MRSTSARWSAPPVDNHSIGVQCVATADLFGLIPMGTKYLNRHFLAVAALATSTAGPYLASGKSPIGAWAGLTGGNPPAKAELASHTTNSSNYSSSADSTHGYSTASSGSKDYSAGSSTSRQSADSATSTYGNATSASTSATFASSASTTAAAEQSFAARTGVTPNAPLAADQEAAKKKLIEGPAPRDLAEVLRFDITTHWIIARWPRVTTGLSVMELQGYRVPLVTGTNEDGLAGSITYYFDKHQVCERIIFHGTSGDPRKLVYLVTSRYGLEREITNDPGLTLYRKKSSSRVDSELRIRPAKVIRADAPRARYEIDLAVKRPS